MVDLSGMFDATDLAMLQGSTAPAGPAPVPVAPGSPERSTVGAIDAAVGSAAPRSRQIPGSAPIQAGGLVSASSAAAPAGLLSDADLGLAPYPESQRGGAAPTATRSDGLLSDEDLGLTSSSLRPLTIRPNQPDTPKSPGLLSNSYDDGYLSGAAKGAVTGAIKGAGDAVGFVGGLSGLADYLIARGESAITGKPVDEVQAAHAARRQAVDADMSTSPLGRLVVATDPTKVLPSPSDVSGPVLARTGEYAPTSEPGKIAQAAVEGVVGAIGPGGGAVSPGTAGKALAGTLARQAPAMAVAGGLGQGITDATRDPLLGLGAGLVGVPLAEAGASMAGRAAAPVLGGSDLLNKAPIIGPTLRRARENDVAGKILAQADDPAAVRAAVAQPAPEPAVPGSPQTFAGQIGNDQGLFEAEKALRNTKAEKVDDGSAPTYFNAVDRGQSAAQIGALQGVRPTGDVFRPGQMIGQRMDAIDAAAEAAIDRLQAAHADAVAGRTEAGQAFDDRVQGDLAARQADRIQAGADFAGQHRADLADRTIVRGQASGDAKAVSDAARQAQHDALVQSFADAHATQLGTAKDAAASLGAPADLNDLGASLRSSVEAVRAGAKDLHRGLYQAVDPAGTLNLMATPVSDRAASIVGRVRADGSTFSPVEAPLFARAAALPDVAPYRVMHALDKDVGAAMSGERRANGETPAWARLSQLKGLIKDAMTNAADHQAAWERSQVDAGAMAPGDTIAARLGGDLDDFRADQQATARANTGTDDGGAHPARAALVPGVPGSDLSGPSGFGDASRDQGVSGARGGGSSPTEVGSDPRFSAPAYDPDGPLRAPRRPDMQRPQDLTAFIRERGGIRDTGGDLASMGLHDLIAKGTVGLSADRMRLLAAEAGYLGADTVRAMRETHPNDLLDAVSGDRLVHSVHDEHAAAAWAAYDDAKERYDAARGEFGTRSRFGVAPERAPLDAYSREDVEGPGGPQVPEPPRSGLTPNFDKAAETRLKLANAAYAQYAKTYKASAVGPGLRTNGYAGQYRQTDSAFIKAAVKPGPDGYANARAFLAAAAHDPEAVAAMHEAVLNPLRRMVTDDGTLPPRGLERWKAADGYAPALRAFDEVSPGFSSRFDNAADATRALIDMGQEHKAALATAQKETARQAILENVQRRDALKQANAADKAHVSALLSERRANDQAAGQADRAAVTSSIAGRRSSDRAANAQSAADMRAGVSAARGIVADARATPAARFAANGGTGVAATEVENAVGSFLKTGTTGATRMRSLVQSVASDPEALAGLRKAGIDWLVRTHTSADGTLSGAKFMDFLRANRDALGELYGSAEVSRMAGIAVDAERGARWRTSTAVKGGSDTVKNLLASLDSVKGSHAGHVTLGMVAVEAISQGLEHAGVKGAAYAGTAAAGAYLLNTLRQAGIKRTADLYREAMANPELARAFVSKMPTSTDAGPLRAVARVLRRGLVVGPMLTGQEALAAQPTRQAASAR